MRGIKGLISIISIRNKDNNNDNRVVKDGNNDGRDTIIRTSMILTTIETKRYYYYCQSSDKL